MLTLEAKNIKVMVQVLGPGPGHSTCRDAYTGWEMGSVGKNSTELRSPASMKKAKYGHVHRSAGEVE